MAFEQAYGKIKEITDNIGIIIKDKKEAINMAVIALLSRGHLLIEDVPGVGKTVLAHSLAKSLACSFRRIQFTSDLLPSDVLGVNIFNPSNREFEFVRGPVFSNVVLADEINRSTPKTQSSLLEAMSEGQVTIDNQTFTLEEPFMVIATQNPKEHYGTYPLPESQLDRFNLRISLGYPDNEHEKKVITGLRTSEKIGSLLPVIAVGEIKQIQSLVERVKMETSVLDYLMTIITGTRNHENFSLGASPRASIAFYRNAQACAMMDGRDYCLPDDVRMMAVPSLAHKVMVKSRRRDVGWSSSDAADAVSELVAGIPVPR